MSVNKGKYIVLYNPIKNLPLDAVISPKSNVLSVLISIKKFHKLFSEDSNNIQFLKDENANQKYYYENKISNPIFLVLNELKRFDINSSTKNLFLKAKIYELFSHLYNRNRDLNIEQCPFLVDDKNIKKIRLAKDIIISRMIEPPTLNDLANEVEISLKKLKQGFKQVYGASVYVFLLDYKMQVSKRLLSSGNYNVNEVALRVGYSTATHFINAFKKKFGTTPKKYLMSL